MKTQKHENPLNTKRSISRYLRYHPINEFEPFFESVGLKPSEYAPLLPRDMIFLNDDPLLMENYHTLCYYGVPRSKMGNFFKQVPQVFRFDYGVLSSKLKAYENLGVAPSTLVDAVAVSPKLLVGDVSIEFVKFVEKFNYLVAKGGGGSGWIKWNLLDGVSCNWGLMLELLSLFFKVDFSEEELGDIIRRRPWVVLEESGGRTMSMIGFLVKFGLSVNQIAFMFLEFPQIRIAKFYANLRQCFKFMTEIEMQGEEIGRIFQSHTLLLGSSALKTERTLRGSLNVGKKRLCRMLQENPQEMENWVLGRKIQPLLSLKDMEDENCKLLKTEFLLSLGYAENSKEMKRAFKVFRGKGAELQKRFDFIIVKAGLKCEDVRKMIRVSPQILNQTTDRINMKMEYLLKVGYPLSDLVTFPSYLSYKHRRVKLRLAMYNWLKDHGVVDPRLALSTIIACTDKVFLEQYVNRHPSGIHVWEDLNKEIVSED